MSLTHTAEFALCCVFAHVPIKESPSVLQKPSNTGTRRLTQHSKSRAATQCPDLVKYPSWPCSGRLNANAGLVRVRCRHKSPHEQAHVSSYFWQL